VSGAQKETGFGNTSTSARELAHASCAAVMVSRTCGLSRRALSECRAGKRFAQHAPGQDQAE
jgi:hypothetical protein